ncbi:hypothetical protein K438DRAFT_1932794 [Mycena galopus ATCC 62051]|nr:hypothetical protein K438DRAFT_1932794 [Mycena galopus ATCC 62051]
MPVWTSGGRTATTTARFCEFPSTGRLALASVDGKSSGKPHRSSGGQYRAADDTDTRIDFHAGEGANRSCDLTDDGGTNRQGRSTELLVEIFKLAVTTPSVLQDDGTLGTMYTEYPLIALRQVLRLSQVSPYWRQIVHNAPQLWKQRPREAPPKECPKIWLF